MHTLLCLHADLLHADGLCDAADNDMFKILTLQEYLDICINAKRVVGEQSLARIDQRCSAAVLSDQCQTNDKIRASTQVCACCLSCGPQWFTAGMGVRFHAGAYIETKHPTWHDSFELPALKGKSMTQLYIEVGTLRTSCYKHLLYWTVCLQCIARFLHMFTLAICQRCVDTPSMQIIKSKGYGGKLDSKRWLKQVGRCRCSVSTAFLTSPLVMILPCG